MMDDAQLLRRYVDEKLPDAFASLVERHLPLVYRTALRLTAGDVHRAEDVAQTVFTLFARKASSLRDFSSVAGWLYVVTRRAARDVRRGEYRRQLREQGAIIMEEVSGPGEPQANWEELRPVLDEALGELGAVDREAILLRFFKGQAFGEIGATLRLSEDAVRMRVGRALEKLRGLLARRGVKSTATALGLLLTGDAALGAPAGLAAAVAQSALAGAGTLTVTGTGAFGIMSTIKIIGAAAVVALTAGMAVYEVRAKREMEVALESGRQDYAALVTKTAEAERAARLAEERVSKKPAPPAPVAKTAVAPTPDPIEAGNALMAAHPELKAALIASNRARIAARFILLYRELNLTDAQRREFEDIMIKSSSSQSNFSGVGGTNKIILLIEKEITTEQKEEQLRALLGDAGHRAIRSNDLGLHVSAISVASALYDSETPLTREQGRALSELFERADVKSSEYWNDLLKQARTFLSEPQLAPLRSMQINNEFSKAADEAVKRGLSR